MVQLQRISHHLHVQLVPKPRDAAQLLGLSAIATADSGQDCFFPLKPSQTKSFQKITPSKIKRKTPSLSLAGLSAARSGSFQSSSLARHSPVTSEAFLSAFPISTINIMTFPPRMKPGCISLRPEKTQPCGEHSTAQLFSQGSN